MFLTDKRRSYNHGVLVVGQLGDAVCVLGGAEIEDIPHIFAFVAHGFGSWTNGSTFFTLARPPTAAMRVHEISLTCFP